jgi:hypothetical protein
MMKKYLLCIASFEGDKQIFFDKFISDRNKEFALEQGYEYIEIREKQSFRNSGTWLKLYNVKKLIDSNFVKEGDHITVIDADMCLVDSRYSLTSEKPFTYAIDSCNTHCMGYYSIKICDWSIRFINELLNEENYLRNGNNDFWRMWAEQSSLYYITGIQRHSDIPFFELPNFGYGIDKRPETVYTPEELLENIEIRNVNYNVTYVFSDIDPINSMIEQYYINKNDYENVIIRHWAGGQMWNEKYFQIPLKK